MRRAFTLVELLVAMAVLAILAGMVTAALGSVNASARRARCETQLVAMNAMLQSRLETFLTLRIDPGAPQPNLSSPWVIGAEWRSRVRLVNLRDEMRMELPDRISDLRALPVSTMAQAYNPISGTTQPVTFQRSRPGTPPPAALMNYRRTIAALRNMDPTNTPANIPAGPNWAKGWSETNEASECLYLILASTTVSGRSGLSMVREDQIADTDGDYIPEILDPWGTPIIWMRWPVGYWLTYADRAVWPSLSETDRALTIQAKKSFLGRDQFDMLSVDERLRDQSGSAELNDTFNIPPVIVSAGPDREFDLMLRSYDAANAQWQFGDEIEYANLGPSVRLNPDPYPWNYYPPYSDDEYGVNYVQTIGNPFAVNTDGDGINGNDRGWVGAYYDADGDEVDDSADNLYSVRAQ